MSHKYCSIVVRESTKLQVPPSPTSTSCDRGTVPSIIQMNDTVAAIVLSCENAYTYGILRMIAGQTREAPTCQAHIDSKVVMIIVHS
jgi:hypothetical protein